MRAGSRKPVLVVKVLVVQAQSLGSGLPSTHVSSLSVVLELRVRDAIPGASLLTRLAVSANSEFR